MFVGMDVHKNYLQIAVLNENGKVLNNSRVDNNLNKIKWHTPVSITDLKIH
jgi:hypothetical protein